jgi:hypothetical protein
VFFTWTRVVWRVIIPLLDSRLYSSPSLSERNSRSFLSLSSTFVASLVLATFFQFSSCFFCRWFILSHMVLMIVRQVGEQPLLFSSETSRRVVCYLLRWVGNVFNALELGCWQPVHSGDEILHPRGDIKYAGLRVQIRRWPYIKYVSLSPKNSSPVISEVVQKEPHHRKPAPTSRCQRCRCSRITDEHSRMSYMVCVCVFASYVTNICL